MPKSPTHFEQIPLEVVKKIARQHVSEDEKAGTDHAVAGESVPKKPRPKARRHGRSL